MDYSRSGYTRSTDLSQERSCTPEGTKVAGRGRFVQDDGNFFIFRSETPSARLVGESFVLQLTTLCSRRTLSFPVHPVCLRKSPDSNGAVSLARPSRCVVFQLFANDVQGHP